MNEFSRRWDIDSTDSPEESFRKFKQRILNILKDIDSHVSDEGVVLFCQYLGISETWESSMYSDSRWGFNIINRLKGENNPKEFFRLIELIFALPIDITTDYNRQETYSKRRLLRDVKAAIDFSDVGLAISETDGDIILYPAGEKRLDEELVNRALSFLPKESNDHFVQALQFAQGKKHVKSAESLRRALEEFLRAGLKNEAGLSTNILELQKRLKTDGRDAQVRNIIFQTFSYLDQYFNENSKHNDGDIDESENEFLIYQTALLLRYTNLVVKN